MSERKIEYFHTKQDINRVFLLALKAIKESYMLMHVETNDYHVIGHFKHTSSRAYIQVVLGEVADKSGDIQDN